MISTHTRNVTLDVESSTQREIQVEALRYMDLACSKKRKKGREAKTKQEV